MTKRSGAPRAFALAGAMALLGCLVPATAGASQHQTVDGLPLTAQAWTWTSNQRFTLATKDPAVGVQETIDVAKGGGKLAAVPGGLSPISPGHVGVSLVNGWSDMRSFFRWDLSAVPPGAKIRAMPVSFTVSQLTREHLNHHLDANARAPFTFGETFARVDACPVTDTLTSSEADPTSTWSIQRPEIERGSTDVNRQDQQLEPKYDCGVSRVRGELSADRTRLNFDLARIAQAWSDGRVPNEGIVLIGVPEGLATTWILELHGMETTLAAEVPSLPVPLPVPLPEAPEQPPNEYVGKEHAATASISFVPPAPNDPNVGAGAGGGTTTVRETVVVNQPGSSETVVVNQPGTTTQETVYAFVPGYGTQSPVADVATPGWVFLGIPLGLLGLGALFGAVGKDELATGGVAIAGSRVASLLRSRRLGA